MSLKCSECKSSNIAKKGFRYNKTGKKQKYYCNNCNGWFVPDDGFKKMRNKPEHIVRAVHMHDDGLSLSKVQNQLFQHDGVKATRWTISQWHKKYSFLKSVKRTSKSSDKRKNSLR